MRSKLTPEQRREKWISGFSLLIFLGLNIGSLGNPKSALKKFLPHAWTIPGVVTSNRLFQHTLRYLVAARPS